MMPSFCSGGPQRSLPLFTVVEYLQSSMSTQLLTKFPDNTPFDFDYSQSSIWSPYRAPPRSTALASRSKPPRLLHHSKRIASQVKKRLAAALLSFKRKRSAYKKPIIGYSPLAPSPTAKVMIRTAAAKRLKKNSESILCAFLEKQLF